MSANPVIDLGYGPLALTTAQYVGGEFALIGTYQEPDEDGYLDPPETLSVNLSGYGLRPSPGNVFIKDWSEHEGWTQKLVDAGLVEIVREVSVGPFSSRAYEVSLLWLKEGGRDGD